jgi:hypothetical protein
VSLTALVEAMTDEQREGAIAVLDAISRPITAREIDAMMVGKGVSRTQRRIVSKAIEPLHIIALLGPEHG